MQENRKGRKSAEFIKKHPVYSFSIIKEQCFKQQMFINQSGDQCYQELGKSSCNKQVLWKEQWKCSFLAFRELWQRTDRTMKRPNYKQTDIGVHWEATQPIKCISSFDDKYLLLLYVIQSRGVILRHDRCGKTVLHVLVISRWIGEDPKLYSNTLLLAWTPCTYVLNLVF